jgi:hypothetical protein
MLKNLTKLLFNLPNLVIVVLVFIVLLQRCGSKPANNKSGKIDTLIVNKTDTIWKEKVKTVYSKPKPTGSAVIDTSWRDSIKLKDSTYNTLLNSYIELGDKYYSRHIYKDTVKIDSVGYAFIKDTVVSNIITGREFTYNIKYPVITNTKTITITQPAPATRQLYVGGSLWMSQSSFVNGLNTGFLYKDKKDRVFGANVGVFNSQVTYGISSYWKIRLSK